MAMRMGIPFQLDLLIILVLGDRVTACCRRFLMVW